MTILKQGSRGHAVLRLQQLLSDKGYSLACDGIFGSGTKAVVETFQKENGVVADGIAGPITLSLLEPAVADAALRELAMADFEACAKRLGIDVATIQAVNRLEASGSGFFRDGRPKILFEGHIFWRQLRLAGLDPKALQGANPGIIYRKWTRKHYRKGVAEYTRLERATAIHKEAALQSASWGAFQIMGFNHDLCGYDSVTDFVSAMYESAGNQLDAFAAFLENQKLVGYLKKRDWAGFAYRYNGPAYRKNRYDQKLESYYRHFVSK